MPRNASAARRLRRLASPAMAVSVLAAAIAVVGVVGSVAARSASEADPPKDARIADLLPPPSSRTSGPAGSWDAGGPAPEATGPTSGPGRSQQPYGPPSGVPLPSRTRQAAPPPPPALPPGCSGNWQYATDDTPMLGTGGALLRFHVAVEYGLPVSLGEFTSLVDQTLGDPRSWVGSGTVRLQRVSAFSGENFTIYLACPWTAYALCRSGGVDTRINGYPYTSCRVGNLVVINADRYIYGASAVMAAGGTLPEYRHYLVNHEVGHRLGYGHVHCPGPGQLAPVMQQQTLRMEKCGPNGWPYPYNPPGTPPTPAPTPTPDGIPQPPRTRDVLATAFVE